MELHKSCQRSEIAMLLTQHIGAFERLQGTAAADAYAVCKAIVQLAMQQQLARSFSNLLKVSLEPSNVDDDKDKDKDKDEADKCEAYLQGHWPLSTTCGAVWGKNKRTGALGKLYRAQNESIMNIPLNRMVCGNRLPKAERGLSALRRLTINRSISLPGSELSGAEGCMG
jgi:hypothetical protein